MQDKENILELSRQALDEGKEKSAAIRQFYKAFNGQVSFSIDNDSGNLKISYDWKSWTGFWAKISRVPKFMIFVTRAKMNGIISKVCPRTFIQEAVQKDIVLEISRKLKQQNLSLPGDGTVVFEGINLHLVKRNKRAAEAAKGHDFREDGTVTVNGATYNRTTLHTGTANGLVGGKSGSSERTNHR